jgi:hypothetical protein
MPLAKQGMKHVIYDIMDRMAEHYEDLVEAWANDRLEVTEVEGVILDHVDHDYEIHACKLVLK